MSVKKGTQFTDANGNVYTVTGFVIKTQTVKYTLEQPGQAIIPGQLHFTDWKKLTATPSVLDEASLANKTEERANVCNGHEIEQVPAKKLSLIKGISFEMTDRSRWKITEYNRNLKKLVAVDLRTEQPQDFTPEQLTELVNDGHIKILS